MIPKSVGGSAVILGDWTESYWDMGDQIKLLLDGGSKEVGLKLLVWFQSSI